MRPDFVFELADFDFQDVAGLEILRDGLWFS
jgi:hypothetical protein